MQPTSHQIDVQATLGPNMQGMLDALWTMMSHIDPSQTLPRHELYAASSFGARHYAYDPQVNLAYDPPRHLSQWSECFSNYGVFESVGFYSGFEVKEFNGLSEEDFWKLMVFELLQDRLVLSIGLHDTMTPCLVVGFEQQRLSRILHVLPAGQSSTVEVNMWGKSLAQGDHEVFQNWMAIVRPSDTPPWSSPANQRLTLLKWVVSHHHSFKEFFHETRENYLAGDSAFDRMMRLFTQELDQIAQAQPQAIIALADLLDDYRQSMAVGRLAMHTSLLDWSERLDEIDRFTDAQRQQTAPLWQEAAAAYLKIAEAFEGWRRDVSIQNLVANPDAAIQALSTARDAEKMAVAALAKSVESVGL